MFFMISGYVIVGSMLRHPTVSGFLRDRFIRIFSAWVPTLCAVTLICAALGMKAFAHLTPFETFYVFVANLFLLPPLAPLPMIHLGSWSLTYEWIFYFAAAGIVASLRAKPAQTWLAALIGIAAILFICLFPRSAFFLTGVLVYQHRDWLARHRRWLCWPSLSFLAFLLAWRFTGADRAQLDANVFDWFSDTRFVAAIIAFAASLHMFSSVTLDVSRQSAFLKSRLFQFLGSISYSFYLWHALVMAVVKRVLAHYVTPHVGPLASFGIFAISCLLIAIPLSWLSWQLFEVRLAKRMRRQLSPAIDVRGAMRVA
jgi:peptidoglycan/LPS O-acetylase OafA/YrhL